MRRANTNPGARGLEHGSGHEPSRAPNLLRVWVISCLISIAVAVAGKVIESWLSCSFHPGGGNCLVRVLNVELYFYAAALVIFVAMTVYVLLAARRRRSRDRA